MIRKLSMTSSSATQYPDLSHSIAIAKNAAKQKQKNTWEFLEIALLNLQATTLHSGHSSSVS